MNQSRSDVGVLDRISNESRQSGLETYKIRNRVRHQTSLLGQTVEPRMLSFNVPSETKRMQDRDLAKVKGIWILTQ